jgi:hypothetical protein
MNANANLYEQDFYAWTMQNAQLLRQGKLAEIDVEHIAEELESMGRSARRELINRLAVLLAYLLKWQLQPPLRGKSWMVAIKEQRRAVTRCLKENPSLQSNLSGYFLEAYEDAVLETVKQTPFEEADLPVECLFTLNQVLDGDFWPD